MKPKTLVIEGLASFREVQTIDFSKLNGLFAITGPTGAGKSSIFDALSLSLWGQFPRAGKSVKDFISLGLKSCRVQLEFSVQGQEYRVTRVFHETRSQEARLERWDGDKWEPLESDKRVSEITGRIEKLTGLNYELFTQVVLLPQGQFDQVLRGDPKERRTLLKQLLGVERFEQVGARARAKAKELSSEVAHIKKRLDGDLAQATSERMLELVDKVSDLDRRLRDLEALDGSLRELEAAKGVDEGQKVELGRVRTAAQELVRERVAIEGERAVGAERERELLGRRETLKGEKEQVELELRDAELQLGGRSRDALVARRAQVEELERACQQTDTGISEARAAVDVLRTELEGYVVRLGALREDATAKRAQLDQAGESVYQARLGEEERKRQMARSQERAKFLEREQELGRELALEKENCQRITLEYEKAREALDLCQKEELRATILEGCQVGDACPVCQEALGEHVFSGEKSGKLAEARERVQHVDQERNRAMLRVGSLEGELDELTRRIRELGNIEDVTSGDTKLQSAELAHREAQRLLGDVLGELLELEEVVREKEKTVRAQEQLLMVRTERERERTEILLRRAAELGVGDAPCVSVADLRSDIEHQLEDVRRAEARFLEAQARRATVVQDERVLLLQLEQHGREVERSQKALDEWAKKSQVLDEDIGRLGGSQPQDRLEWITREEEALRLKIEEKAARLEALRARVRETGYDDVQSGLRRIAEERGRVQGDLARLRDLVGERERLLGEVVASEEKVMRYSRLADALRENQFTEYLMEAGVEELVQRASSELDLLSNGRYGLSQEGSSINVVDRFRGDRVRGAHTLSGGESFLASLALGMALAGRDQGHQETLFIDEGFGTLDRGMLDDIVEALERLEDTGRMIGIVTHVAELASRLERQLVIETGSTGSSTARLLGD